MEFVIKGNRVILPQGIKKSAVLVKDGIIDAVWDFVPDDYKGPVTDIGNKLLMAGITDPHVHINEPGRTEWEGFETATKAAVAGGITMLVDMPLNASPVTTSVEAFQKKLDAANGKLFTNVGFWGGLVPGNADEIEGLIQKGVLGFKAFLTHSGIDEFPNVTETDLRKAMPVIARYGLPLLVHCELSDPLHISNNDNVQSYDNYLSSRPEKWEDDAIAMMIRLCREFNCRIHVVHLSSAGSIAQIAAAKKEGLPLTVETGQHYLYFNAEDIKDGQTAVKCAPPIREKENNDQLWEALQSGIIDFVATDHSPAPPDLKQMETGDFMQAWGGISSVQFALPVLWTAAKERGCLPQQMAKWLSENPARLVGMQDRKGRIAEGFDADFVVWDDEKTFTVDASGIYHKHKITPYLGETLSGVVEQTYIAGVKVFDNDDFIGKNGMSVLGIV